MSEELDKKFKKLPITVSYHTEYFGDEETIKKLVNDKWYYGEVPNYPENSRCLNRLK